MSLTQGQLKSILKYSPRTGRFVWKVDVSRRVKAGNFAGTVTSAGYVIIRFNRKGYYAHRLAWLYMHGVTPKKQIDHRDTCKANNQIKNLRLATSVQNLQNQQRPHHHNKAGYLGVTRLEVGLYKAQIQYKGTVHYLGRFVDPGLAHKAYLKAKRKLHEYNRL